MLLSAIVNSVLHKYEMFGSSCNIIYLDSVIKLKGGGGGGGGGGGSGLSL